jgi:hypothetical protein
MPVVTSRRHVELAKARIPSAHTDARDDGSTRMHAVAASRSTLAGYAVAAEGVHGGAGTIGSSPASLLYMGVLARS